MQTYDSWMAILNFHSFGDPAGEPLLAVHGITAHGRRFRRLAEDAWPERRTIAVDLRGHGHSTWDAPWSIHQLVDDVVDTLDSLGLHDPIDLVGHSYGGAIGLTLFAKAPERIKRFVMLDPALARPPEFAAENAAATLAGNGWASVEEATIARNAGLGDEINPAVTEDIASHLQQSDDGRYRFRYDKAAVVGGWGEMCYPLPAALSHRPTLLVNALRAGIVAESTVEHLTTLLGDDLSVVRIDCGHMLYWERFDETAAAVTDFFART